MNDNKNKNSNKEEKEFENSYIAKFHEWQEHLSDLWYYTGGKILPAITHTGRPRLLGWFLIISAIFVGGVFTLILSTYIGTRAFTGVLCFLCFGYVLLTLQFIGGIRLLKKSRKGNKSLLRSKKFLFFVGIMLAITISLVSVYLYNEQTSQFKINSIDQYTTEQIIGSTSIKNLIYLKEIDFTLQCSIDDYTNFVYKRIFDEKEEVQKRTYIITYKWNKLFPNKGKIINVETFQR